MTNFIIGAICGVIFGIAALLILGYITFRIDEKKKFRKDIGEDYDIVFMPKSMVEKLEKDKNCVED